MLSRRNLRVKVMQVLYAIEHSNNATFDQAIGMLDKSIDKSYKLLVFNFALIVRIADHVKNKSYVKSLKLLPSEQDLQFSTRLVNNPFVNALRSDQKVSDRLRLTMTEEENTLVKELFKKMSEENEYKLYCSKMANGSEDKEIIAFIFSNVIKKNQSYVQYVEDNFSECVAELVKINFGVEELLGKLSPEHQKNKLEFPDFQGEDNFAKQLLEQTLANNERYAELVKPKLKNWDIDRIAHIDMILMKMVLCELLCFEPTTVSSIA